MTGLTCSADGCQRGGKLTRGMCQGCYRRWLDTTPVDERGLAPRSAIRFQDRVAKTHEHGCWLWTGPTDDGGYGRWKRTLAHRHAWEEANGPIPEGKWILHHCDNPPCVNPSHLYPGTVVENVRDMVTRGRAHIPPRKVTCNAGHAIEGDNLREMVTGTGEVRRCCRACDNKRSADRQRAARRVRGLRKTKLSAEEKRQICELRRAGMAQRKIAAEVGRSLVAVQSVLKGAGL